MGGDDAPPPVARRARGGPPPPIDEPPEGQDFKPKRRGAGGNVDEPPGAPEASPKASPRPDGEDPKEAPKEGSKDAGGERASVMAKRASVHKLAGVQAERSRPRPVASSKTQELGPGRGKIQFSSDMEEFTRYPQPDVESGDKTYGGLFHDLAKCGQDGSDDDEESEEELPKEEEKAAEAQDAQRGTVMRGTVAGGARVPVEDLTPKAQALADFWEFFPEAAGAPAAGDDKPLSALDMRDVEYRGVTLPQLRQLRAWLWSRCDPKTGKLHDLSPENSKKTLFFHQITMSELLSAVVKPLSFVASKKRHEEYDVRIAKGKEAKKAAEAAAKVSKQIGVRPSAAAPATRPSAAAPGAKAGDAAPDQAKKEDKPAAPPVRKSCAVSRASTAKSRQSVAKSRQSVAKNRQSVANMRKGSSLLAKKQNTKLKQQEPPTSQCSFVELVTTRPPNKDPTGIQAPEVPKKKPAWYVCHWWGQPLADFVACLEEHAKLRGLGEHDTYWVYGFACDEHTVPAPTPVKEGQVFAPPTLLDKPMHLAQGMLVLLDPRKAPFHRLWQCYEMHCAIQLSCERAAGGATKEALPRYLVDFATLRGRPEGVEDPRHGVVLTEGLSHSEMTEEIRWEANGYGVSGWAEKVQRELPFPVMLLTKGLLQETQLRAGLRVNVTLLQGAQTATEQDKKRLLDALGSDVEKTACELALKSLIASSSWPQMIEQEQRGEELDHVEQALVNDPLRENLIMDFAAGRAMNDAHLTRVLEAVPLRAKRVVLTFARCDNIRLEVRPGGPLPAIEALVARPELERLELSFQGCVNLGSSAPDWLTALGKSFGSRMGSDASRFMVKLDFRTCGRLPSHLRRRFQSLETFAYAVATGLPAGAADKVRDQAAAASSLRYGTVDVEQSFGVPTAFQAFGHNVKARKDKLFHMGAKAVVPFLKQNGLKEEDLGELLDKPHVRTMAELEAALEEVVAAYKSSLGKTADGRDFAGPVSKLVRTNKSKVAPEAPKTNLSEVGLGPKVTLFRLKEACKEHLAEHYLDWPDLIRKVGKEPPVLENRATLVALCENPANNDVYKKLAEAVFEPAAFEEYARTVMKKHNIEWKQVSESFYEALCARDGNGDRARLRAALDNPLSVVMQCPGSEIPFFCDRRRPEVRRDLVTRKDLNFTQFFRQTQKEAKAGGMLANKADLWPQVWKRFHDAHVIRKGNCELPPAKFLSKADLEPPVAVRSRLGAKAEKKEGEGGEGDEKPVRASTALGRASTAQTRASKAVRGK